MRAPLKHLDRLLVACQAATVIDVNIDDKLPSPAFGLSIVKLLTFVIIATTP